MKKSHQSQAAFTIVELLIVIVVLGIIATISIYRYAGSQARPRNAKTASAAEQYKDGFENYLTLKKQYPPVSTSSWYCLNIDVTSCVNTASAASWVRSTTLETELKKVMDSSLPVPGMGPGTNSLSDPQLGYIPYKGTGDPTLDGTNSGFLIYVLEGTTSCPIGPVASGTSGSLTFTSATPVNNRTYTASNMTVCWVPLSTP